MISGTRCYLKATIDQSLLILFTQTISVIVEQNACTHYPCSLWSGEKTFMSLLSIFYVMLIDLVLELKRGLNLLIRQEGLFDSTM